MPEVNISSRSAILKRMFVRRDGTAKLRSFYLNFRQGHQAAGMFRTPRGQKALKNLLGRWGACGWRSIGRRSTRPEAYPTKVRSVSQTAAARFRNLRHTRVKASCHWQAEEMSRCRSRNNGSIKTHRNCPSIHVLDESCLEGPRRGALLIRALTVKGK